MIENISKSQGQELLICIVLSVIFAINILLCRLITATALKKGILKILCQLVCCAICIVMFVYSNFIYLESVFSFYQVIVILILTSLIVLLQRKTCKKINIKIVERISHILQKINQSKIVKGIRK